MPEMFRVTFWGLRQLAPALSTLIAARTLGEAHKMARRTARKMGFVRWQVEG